MSALLATMLVLVTPASPGTTRRLAVLVGSNTPPAGRPALRFAHRDAARLRDTLVRVGEVKAEDATLLLDPRADEVLAALERASAIGREGPGETVLYFYYSGHADDVALYPGGEPLPIERVRQWLVEDRATVRVGILDACRGGSWTRAKGLRVAPPVPLPPPMALSAEGTVLFASSSGLEDAHESDRLEASFFTHHLIGGLLGAADASGDGAVTATEAFQYAQARTVRDSALASVEPQHPSFQLNLAGRKDVVLARLVAGSSTLALEQQEGPLQVVELPAGLVLLELPEGKRSSRLSVGPGAYLVRRMSPSGVVTAREVNVRAGELTTIEESSLTLVGVQELERKGDGAPPWVQQTVLPAKKVSLGLGLGVRHDPRSPASENLTGVVAVSTALEWSPVENLQLSLFPRPGVTYRFRLSPRSELALVFGMERVGFGYSNLQGWLWALYPTAGAVLRWWPGASTSLSVGAQYVHGWEGDQTPAPQGPRTLSSTGAVVQFAFSHTFNRAVTLSLGLSTNYSVAFNPLGQTPLMELGVGGARVGLRNLPLVRIHVSPVWSIDLDAQIGFRILPVFQSTQVFLGGFTATF